MWIGLEVEQMNFISKTFAFYNCPGTGQGRHIFIQPVSSTTHTRYIFNNNILSVCGQVWILNFTFYTENTKTKSLRVFRKPCCPKLKFIPNSKYKLQHTINYLEDNPNLSLSQIECFVWGFFFGFTELVILLGFLISVVFEYCHEGNN